MSAEKQRRYRFATEAQWSECLFAAVDQALLAKGKVRPFVPFARTAMRYKTEKAFAPAVTPPGETLWRDDAGALHRLIAGQDPPEIVGAPQAIARAGRIVATASGLSVLGTTRTLERFDVDSLTREITVALPAAAIDLADRGHGGVVALVRADDEWQVLAYDEAGRPAPSVVLTGISNATALVFLRRSGRFVVLDAGRVDAVRRQPRLLWFAPAGGAPLVGVAIAGLRPCFTADALGSDGRERVYLAGAEDGEDGVRARVVMFDEAGDEMGDVPLDQRATGVTATADALIVTDKDGLSRFGGATVVPDDAAQAACLLVTPVLHSPDRADQRRWLRAEASVDLPAGSTIAIDVAATDDALVRDRLNAIAQDGSKPASARAHAVFADPDVARYSATEFHGSDDAANDADPSYASYAAKLFDIRQRYLWVRVTLTAAPGGRLPVLAELDVLYPGHTLMESLPGIYQREQADPTSFLRALVGVVESTTQGLDQRIAAMGSLIDPATAKGPWLDFVARWLGVPWDDALEDAQKRAILNHAEELAKGRGTRAGLETLLACLIPGTPPRFRVTDATADLGFAVLGGGACVGNALPAILGGSTRWSAELDVRAVLGYMRLPCPNQREDGAWRLAGRVRVDVAATAAERQAWEPWLATLMADMMPVTARAQLHWVSKQALRSHRLDGTYRLEPAPVAHLGTDAVTGLARLPATGTRLSDSGSSTGIRLV